MEKEENNMTRSGDDELHENPWGYKNHQFSKLFNVLFGDYSKSKEEKACNLQDSISDEVYREKIKAVKALRVRMMNLTYGFDPKYIALLFFLCRKTMKAAKRAKYRDHLFSLFHSTDKFINEQYKLKNIHVLVDLASTELKNIKAYNSKTLPLLEAENLNEVTLQEMSNHYSSFYKGIRSLNLQVAILIYHLGKRQHDLETLVDIFLTSVEGELRQYEKELETTVFKLFQLAKTKFRLGWLPDSWKGTLLSLRLKTYVLRGIEYNIVKGT